MKARIAILTGLWAVLIGSCADQSALLGSGASLTTTPCTTCAMADRPTLSCPAGQAPRCFERSNGTCGWKAACADPPEGSVCPAIACDVNCPGGFAKDAAGCDTCSCQPPTGTCPPVCQIFCQYGNVSDANGCPTCACNPPPAGQTCGPVCAIACPYGEVKDAEGCPTCQCNPPPDPNGCGPVCAIACDYGNVLDAKGCPTCACNPPPDPKACGPVCAIFCQYGNVLDAKGCPTCTCNPPPGGGSILPTCPADKCGGPIPPVAPIPCPDGKTVAGPVCVPVPDGVCAWTVLNCPDAPPPLPETCPPEKCPGPIPPVVPYTCADGTTVAGPGCVPDASGTCGWIVVNCP